MPTGISAPCSWQRFCQSKSSWNDREMEVHCCSRRTCFGRKRRTDRRACRPKEPRTSRPYPNPSFYFSESHISTGRRKVYGKQTGKYTYISQYAPPRGGVTIKLFISVYYINNKSYLIVLVYTKTVEADCLLMMPGGRSVFDRYTVVSP